MTDSFKYNYELFEQRQKSILVESAYPDGRKAFGISFKEFASIFKKKFKVDLIAIARELIDAEKTQDQPETLAASYHPNIGKYLKLVSEVVSNIEEVAQPREGANIHFLTNFQLKVIMEGCYRVVGKDKKEISQHGVLGKGAKRSSKLVHSSTRKKVKPDEKSFKKDIIELGDGTEIDLLKLKQKFLEQPKAFVATNTKLAASSKVVQANTKMDASGKTQKSKFFDITLPAYSGLYYDLKQNAFGLVSTCPGAGECVVWCYAAKGGYLMFENSALNGAKFLTNLINNPEKIEQEILSVVTKKSKDKIFLRWHDAGDFFSKGYLQFAIDIARKTPDVIHYAYTKNFKLIRSMQNEFPENFVFNFSTGSNVEGTPEDINPENEKVATVLPYSYFNDLNVSVPETYGLIKSQGKMVENKKRLGWKSMVNAITDWVYKNNFADKSIKNSNEFKSILESMIEASGIKHLPFNKKRTASVMLSKMLLYKDGANVADIDITLDDEDQEQEMEKKIKIDNIPIKKQLFNDAAFNKKNFRTNLGDRRKLSYTFEGKDLDTLKTNAQSFIKTKFGLDIDKSLIKTYDEAEEQGIISDMGKSMKYVVLVWGGHGDAEATTKNVRMTLLLQH